MITSTRRRRRSRAQWQSLIERAERTPLSVQAFCQAEGISTPSFYAWRKRLSTVTKVAIPPAGVPVQGADSGAFLDLGRLESKAVDAGPWDIELELGAGFVLRLRRG